MSDEQKKPQWKLLGRVLFVALGAGVLFFAYMCAYYATVTV